MKNRSFKRIVWITVSTLFTLIIVVGVHVYLMTRTKPPGATGRIMARIDFRQDITQGDADSITAWLYQQKGIDHVLCNPASNIAVFTYYPSRTNADYVVSNLKTRFNYKAQRFVPDENELRSSCPVLSNSITDKMVTFIKQTF